VPALSFTLDFDDFDALRRLIRDHCGIWLGDTKVSFLQVRLADRMQAWNISSPREYYYFVKYDASGSEEIQRLVDAVTVNETWFFRETGPVEAWREAVLPGLLERGGRVRLWSAGCATGEEPYTLAMLLLEACSEVAVAQIEILATDISQRALEAARAAVYDPHSLRHTEPYRLARYFRTAPAGRYAVREDVRRLVRFGHTNLVDLTLAERIRAMDLVLCRNLIIYLDDQGRQVALDNLHAALRPGGYLTLGHSESLIHVTTPFEVARVGGSIMYRKRSTRGEK
jgi:chemotaxis protein methyltransferase CheR